MFEAFLAKIATVSPPSYRTGLARRDVRRVRSRWNWKVELACLAATTIAGISPASAADVNGWIAPVSKVKKENRFETRTSLPPVIYRQPLSKRQASEVGTERNSIAPSPQSVDEEDALRRVPEPPVLAPVIRGRPPKAQLLERARVQTVQPPVPAIPSEPKRSSVGRDRTVMRIPSVLTTDRSPSAKIAAMPVQDSSYGDTKSLSEAVTIDLRDAPAMVSMNQNAAVGRPIASLVEPALLSPTALPPVTDNVPQGETSGSASGSHLRQPPSPIAIDLPGENSDYGDQELLADSVTHSGADEQAFQPQCGNASVFQPASAHLSPMSFPRLAVSQLAAPPATSPSDLAPPTTGENQTPEGLPDAKSVEPVSGGELFRPIQQVRIDIAPAQGALPENRAAERFAQEGEQFQPTGFSRVDMETSVEWDAPAMCHRPLFFEDVNLERHGVHVKYMQPLFSAAHFFTRIPATPYLALSQRSRVCNYTLGHYQPGSYAPYVWYYPRPSLAGISVESAVIAGLILAIP